MTPNFGQVVNWLLLAVLVAFSWLLPRRFGILGIIASQVLVAIEFIGMGWIALETGLWVRYDGVLTILGLLVQAFVFNLLLLPVGCIAAWRRRSARAVLESSAAVACRHCGYDLTGNTSGTCPECGTPSAQKLDVGDQRPSPRP